MYLDRRRKRLLRLTEEKGFESLVAGTPPNVFYLTGFWGEGMAILDNSSTKLYVAMLEKERAMISSVDCDVVGVERGFAIFDRISSNVGNKRTCFDDVPSSVSSQFTSRMQRASLDPTIFQNARRAKDEEELGRIKGASEVIDKLYKTATEILKPGMSEREISAHLLYETLVNGCEPANHISGLSPLIVASGPNSAYPHARVSERKLKEGDVVVLDLFVRFEGYYSDCTRTFIIGNARTEVKRAYGVVLHAQEEGRRAVKPEISGSEVDQATRKVIAEKGYGELFVHGTGHGVGLDIHELPWVRPKAEEPLIKGDIITIEPAVYIPGKFGIRIEDSLFVSDRPIVLNKFTKEMLELG